MSIYNTLQRMTKEDEDANPEESVQDTINRVFEDSEGASLLIELMDQHLHMEKERTQDVEKDLKRDIRRHRHDDDGTVVVDY